jgi:hypothetical protein
MLGAGTVINPIVRIVTTVAILAAVYFFIVKPVLDTTDNVVNQSFDRFDQSFQEGFDDLPGQIQSEIDQAFGSNGSQLQRLHDCIQRAFDGGGSPNTQRINRCVGRFSS